MEHYSSPRKIPWAKASCGSQMGRPPGPCGVKDFGAAELTPPSNLINLNGVLYFAATSNAGRELWKSDGTEVGTVLVKDINPGATSSNPANLTIVGETIFTSSPPTASAGWNSGCRMARPREPRWLRTFDLASSRSSSPADQCRRSALLRARTTVTNGVELVDERRYRGRDAPVKDIVSTSGRAVRRSQLPPIRQALLRVNDGDNGIELWRKRRYRRGTLL